ncbi:tRNA pseudouridine(55) synthase TruB [Gilliamella sp. App6-5]|uniref:tRNA pseudouridine(55) synthase TruB n=1 Tax=Gilliamella sp. App6-5 TaxID=3120232 RepID=UPI00080E45E8|nr:tRNA pseudouridine(55) synthase TruB [Gilliamella apicola]OCG15975.1 tRNA pseudouridine(55) synthase TruB [Gilliamella apicola]
MMNIKRTRRDLHGVLLLDKPQGMTSNDALQKVKWLFNAKKAGHTGALDPLATGMLPICFGEATKFSQYLLDSDKRYRVIAKLGERTDTSDADGQIICTKPVKVNESQINQALTHFRGDILQVPTMFSALKYQGKPLYEYARQGIVIEREARPITVYENQFIQFDAIKNELTLEIHCSKGTYIRTIIDDLGELLGCGAHVIYLRRLQVSNYPIDKMIRLDALQNRSEKDELLMPVDSPLQGRPKITLTNAQGKDILLGRTIELENSTHAETLVRIYQGQQFIGAGVMQSNKLSPKRLISTL